MTGWRLADDGKSMTHVDGGKLTRTEAGGVWVCECGAKSAPVNLNRLDPWVAWRDRHKACGQRSKR